MTKASTERSRRAAELKKKGLVWFHCIIPKTKVSEVTEAVKKIIGE